MKRMINVAQILQVFSYKLCSTTSPNITAFIPVFEISAIVHQQLVAMLRGHMRFVE